MATEISNLRLRSLLRQAQKVAGHGKRDAAAQLYRQLVAEAPEIEAAWVGLAEVEVDVVKKEEAYQRALALNPENRAARIGMAQVRGEEIPAELIVELPPPPPIETQIIEEPETIPTPSIGQAVSHFKDEHDYKHPSEPEKSGENEYDLVCYRHPNRETSLRCYTCGKPICSSCAVKTPVGYSCPDCIREKEDVFFNASPLDYIIAPAVSFPLSLIAGYLVLRLGGGIFFIFLMFFLAGLVGRFIGRMTKRAIGHRRGRYLPQLVGTMIILGAFVPTLPFIILIFSGVPGVLTLFLMPGIYAFVATGAAFYEMK